MSRVILGIPPLVDNLHLHFLSRRRSINPLQLKALAAVFDTVRDGEAVRECLADGAGLVRRAEEGVARGGGTRGGLPVGFGGGQGLVVFAADSELARGAGLAEVALPAAGGLAAGQC